MPCRQCIVLGQIEYGGCSSWVPFYRFLQGLKAENCVG